jgi:hypothetical protein
MNIAKLKQAGNSLTLATALFIFASCKPAEETKPEPLAPAITNAPVAVEPVVTTNAPILIGPTKARDHIGKTATVRGVVTDVQVSQKGDVFLNFGGKYPNAVFTAVCFQNAIPTDQLTALKGKTISVSGKIKDYNGQVEIVLESADQISR